MPTSDPRLTYHYPNPVKGPFTIFQYGDEWALYYIPMNRMVGWGLDNEDDSPARFKTPEQAEACARLFIFRTGLGTDKRKKR